MLPFWASSSFAPRVGAMLFVDFDSFDGVVPPGIDSARGAFVAGAFEAPPLTPADFAPTSLVAAARVAGFGLAADALVAFVALLLVEEAGFFFAVSFSFVFLSPGLELLLAAICDTLKKMIQ